MRGWIDVSRFRHRPTPARATQCIPSYASGAGTTIRPCTITTTPVAMIDYSCGGLLTITNDGVHPGNFALPWQATPNAAPECDRMGRSCRQTSGTAGWFDLPSALPTVASFMEFAAGVSNHSVPTLVGIVGCRKQRPLVNNTLGCLDGYDRISCIVYAHTVTNEATVTGSYATVLFSPQTHRRVPDYTRYCLLYM